MGWLTVLHDIFKKIDSDSTLNREDLRYILGIQSKDEQRLLFEKAYEVKERYIGNKAHFRGIVEFSNICMKDCYYCGIRRSKPDVERFMMKEEEILKAAEWAWKNNYGSVVLQSGERDDAFFIQFVEKVLAKIKELSNGELGITISLGEQTRETYQRWFNAGAHRYLLRIESSNPELYKKLHPPDHDFERRRSCLDSLREVGYQVGTGVMIGLPFQTLDHLVDDLLFFQEQDVDMIGMGPYIVSEGTPLANEVPDFSAIEQHQFELSLRMIAAARLLLKDVNIASTTALQALKVMGREMGLKAGANIIMPNTTDVQYRPSYQLYENKPCIDENADDCVGCLEARITGIDEEIGLGEWGDSPHFRKRTKAGQAAT
jgi:biotin synthase